jgi:GT2 family glycosyltransferase
VKTEAGEPISLIAVMTSFNRRTATLACLARFEGAARQAGVEPKAMLLDDGSTDGTAAAVREQYPWVVVMVGDGSLFWNRGMHQAQARAMESGADYLLWLNDDTELMPDSITRLLETENMLRHKHGQPVMVVGSTADRVTGRLTYGGHVAPQRWRPFTYERVWHESQPVECHVMNGNVVLIPMQIAHVVGNLDPAFEHAMGDYDYALRARAKGFRVFVAPGFVGHCSNNPALGTYRDRSLPLSVRWKKMMSRKGLPPRSWGHLTRRHGGLAWPVYFVWPYFKLLATEIRRVRTDASRQM